MNFFHCTDECKKYYYICYYILHDHIKFIILYVQNAAIQATIVVYIAVKAAHRHEFASFFIAAIVAIQGK